jgi:hypothetical protein
VNAIHLASAMSNGQLLKRRALRKPYQAAAGYPRGTPEEITPNAGYPKLTFVHEL